MNKNILVNVYTKGIRILGVLVVILAGLGSVEVSTVHAQSPIIMVRPNRDWVDGWDWIPGETITLSIDKPDNGPGVDYSSSEEITDASFSFRVGDVYDIEPGDVVTVYGNISDITKEHVVTHVSIVHVDLNSQIIYGNALPNVRVDVSVNYDQCFLTVTSDGNGEWEADFTVCGLRSRNELQAREWEDDGDSTMIDSIIIPSIYVGLHRNNIEDEDWPDDATLTLSIDDPTNGAGEDYSAQIIANQGEQNRGYLGFALYDQFQIQPGHVVTVSGGAFEITHIVKNPQVTNIDFEEDIVSGTCSPGATVMVQLDWIEGGRWVIVDMNGNWSADFSEYGENPKEQFTFNITPASRMKVACSLQMEAGLTEMKLPINSSTILHGDVSGNNWTIGQPVILEIDDPETLDYLDYIDQAWPEPGPWLTTEVHFSVAESIDIQPGFLVIMTQGAQVKTHVVTDIEISNVNLDEDTVSGTAAPYAYVTVDLDWGEERSRMIQADSTGHWTADFSVPSTVPYEEIIDITADNAVSVYEWDDQSNRTGVDWVPPTARVQDTIEELDTILSDPGLDPDVADAIEDALVNLEGSNGGQGNNGALDKLEGGDWNAALVKIEKAIEDLEGAESADPTLDLSEIKEVLSLTAKTVVLGVIEQAQAVASTPADWQAIDQALALLAEGEALLEAGDYLSAMDKFRDALEFAQSVLS